MTRRRVKGDGRDPAHTTIQTKFLVSHPRPHRFFETAPTKFIAESALCGRSYLASSGASELSYGFSHCPDQSAEAAWFQNMRFLELQSYAAGILDNSPAIQGVYILNINVFCSVRKSQKELVSVYLWGLLCQLLDEFAAVEAAVEVSPQ